MAFAGFALPLRVALLGLALFRQEITPVSRHTPRATSRLKLVKQLKVSARIALSVVRLPSRTRAQRALSPTAYPEARRPSVGRWVGCVAFLSLLATAESTGCGSKSDLIIGRNGVATPVEAGGGTGGADTGGTAGSSG